MERVREREKERKKWSIYNKNKTQQHTLNLWTHWNRNQKQFPKRFCKRLILQKWNSHRLMSEECCCHSCLMLFMLALAMVFSHLTRFFIHPVVSVSVYVYVRGNFFIFHFTFMCECVLYSWFSHFQTFDSFGISLHFLLLHPFAMALSFNVWFSGVNKTVYVWYIFASAPSHQVIGNSSTSISSNNNNNKKNHFQNSAYCTACSTKVTHTNGIPV